MDKGNEWGIGYDREEQYMRVRGEACRQKGDWSQMGFQNQIKPRWLYEQA